MKRHATAMQAAIESGKNRLSDDHAPLIELCRVLADQMDEAAAGPSARLVAAYLSALKDMSRALATTPRKEGLGKLAELRRNRPIRPSGPKMTA